MGNLGNWFVEGSDQKLDRKDSPNNIGQLKSNLPQLVYPAHQQVNPNTVDDHLFKATHIIADRELRLMDRRRGMQFTA